MIKGQLLGIPNWLKKKIEKNEHASEEINSKIEEVEIGYKYLALTNGVGTIDFSDTFSSISACIVCQNGEDYVVQYAFARGTNLEFKISKLDGSVNSFSYGVSYMVKGVRK